MRANSSKKGKNGFVARKLSEALSSFLEIDESLVQSRLLNPTKSKITLKNIKVKPRIIHENSNEPIELSGNIEKVQFKWQWNYFNTSKTYKGLMKKTALIIEGAKLQLSPVSESTSADHSISSENTVLEKDEELPDKKQPKLIRHIIEQFSIQIEDIEVHIKVPSNNYQKPKETPGRFLLNPFSSEAMETSTTFVVRAVGLELDPVGYYKKMKKKKLLKLKQDKSQVQEIRVGALSARVLEENWKGKVTSHWIIEPFQYSAIARRFHGERFSDFGTGLEVIGNDVKNLRRELSFIPLSSSLQGSFSVEETEDNSLVTEEIEVRMETEEIETLLFQDMRQLALADKLGNNTNVKSNDQIRMRFMDVQSRALFAVVKFLTAINKEESKVKATNEETPSTLLSSPLSVMSPYFKKQEVNNSSTFHFPIPHLEAVLPNDAIVVARDCVFNFRTDGSTSLFESNGGISINGKRLLEGGSSLSVDLTENDIILRPQPHKHDLDKKAGLSDFMLDMNSIGLMKEGVERLAHSLKSTKEVETLKVKGSTVGEGWSLKVQGTAEIKLT